MLNTLIHKLKLTFSDEVLRKRIFFVLAALVIFRILATIPIPGVDVLRLEEFFSNNEFLGLMNIFSGGGLSNLSIVMLGVGPFITASIIMQLMTVLVPKVKAMYHEEGEAGRIKFSQYSRYLTVPLAFLQAFAFLTLLTRQGIVANTDIMTTITNVIVIVAGSLLLMWVGELVTEFGIGNGVSLIIFAGIVAGLPAALSQVIFSFDASQIPTYVGFTALTILVTAAVVFITEAERPIPVTYARQTRGGKTGAGVSSYLPLRVNQAGVIPIIFAISMVLLPQMIAGFLVDSSVPAIASAASAVNTAMANQLIYGSIYFALVFLFTFFYTAITFEPNKMADNLQKSGAFIPGIRPGEHTSEYVGTIVTRITLVGALFLGTVAVLPIVVEGVTGIATITIGGTALLIAVSVVLDLVKKVEAQISIREY